MKFDIAKKGDRVYSIQFGWGTISELNNDSLLVLFKDCVKFFNKDGTSRLSENECPTLFWNEIIIPKETDDDRFNLSEFVFDNIKIGEFNKNDMCACFILNNNKIDYRYDNTKQENTIYTNSYNYDYICDILNKKHIEYSELINILKKSIDKSYIF